MNKAVLLDRDGVINRKAPEGEYITTWGSFEFLPGVSEGISLLRESGYRVIVVSNQRCVAKGLVTTQEVDALHKQMCEELSRQGALVDRVYYCPHDYCDGCACRKPKPGMLLKALDEFGLSPAASWMVGDSSSDMEAGRSAGLQTVFVSQHNKSGICADMVAGSLLEAARAIIARTKGILSAPISSL